MAYTVLARKYRSQSFDDVVGQEAIAQTLKNAIKTGRVHHAYFMTGTRGVGKTTMARILAKALNCLSVDEPTIEPCCECESCKSINTGDDIDVIEIDGASNNGVDNIRELRQNAIYRPARSRYKIYIIDEVHMLSAGAFNALLKILEEPPEHVKFIFATTEPNKVLPTIQSRCQRFDFRAIDALGIGSQLKRVLKSEEVAFEEDAIISLSRLANGSMRDALSLLDQVISSGITPLTLEVVEQTLGEPGREKIAELVEKMGDSDAASVLAQVDKLLVEGMSCVQIVDALIDYIRDLMVLKASGEKTNIVILTPSEKEKALVVSKMFDIAALVYNITSLEKMRWTIKNADNPRALMEAAMVRMALSENFINVSELMNKLASGSFAVKKNSLDNSQSLPEIPSQNSTHKKKTQSSAQTRNQSKPAQTALQASLSKIPCGNLQELQSRWSEIAKQVAVVDGMIGASISSCVPSEFDGKVLKLAFSKCNAMNKTLCESNGRDEKLRKFLSEILGQIIRVVFVIEESSTIPTRTRSKGAGTSSRDVKQVMHDGNVKMLLDGLRARVVKIED